MPFNFVKFTKIILIPSLFFITKKAIADDFVINGYTDQRYELSEEGQSLTTTITGNITINDSSSVPAISVTASNTLVSIESSPWTGISSSSSEAPAIEVNGDNLVSTIFSKSLISSGTTFENGATINLNNGGTTNITLENFAGNSAYLINYNLLDNGLAIKSSRGDVVFNNNGGNIFGGIFVEGGNFTFNNSGIFNSEGADVATYDASVRIDNVGDGVLDITNSGIIYGEVKLGSNANSKITSSGLIQKVLMGNSSQILTIEEGGSISQISGPGSVYYKTNWDVLAPIGDEDKIGKVILSDGKEITLFTDNVFNVETIELGNNSTFKPREGKVSANFAAKNDGDGKIIFEYNNNNFLANIGSADKQIGFVGIESGVNLNIGNYNYNVSKTEIANNASLTVGSGEITGTFDSVSGGDDAATINISANNNFSSATKFGDVNGFSALNIADNVAITLNQNAKANNVNIGLDSGNSSLVLSDEKTISGNVIISQNSSLTLKNNSQVDGVINGSSVGFGSLNFEGNNILNNDIGGVNKLAEVNVLSDSNLILNNDVAANQINVLGAISLANSSRNIAGNLNIESNAAIDLGKASHQVLENFTASSNSVIALEINSGEAGNLIVAESAFIDANTKLFISVLTPQEQNASYAIISGDSSSSISKVLDENIIVNSSIGTYKFTSLVSNNSLILKLLSFTPESADSKEFGNNPTYNAIKNVNNPSGTLDMLRQFINSPVNSDVSKSEAIKSASPNPDNSPNRVIFDTANSTFNIIQTRLQSASGIFTAKAYNKDSASGISSGDESAKRNIWAQSFGSSISQGNAKLEGYDANTAGFAFGVDKEISEDVVFGLSGNYARSKSKSRDNLRSLNIDTYQSNAYLGYDFDKYFTNYIVGFAWNRYEGNRAIPLFGLNASSKYSGKSYMGRFEAGVRQKLKNDFVISPFFALTTAYNQISDYNENGAGSLNLRVKSDSSSFFETRAGAALSRKFISEKGSIFIPEVSASYGYDFARSRQKITSNFVGQQIAFDSNSSRPVQGSFKAGTSLNFALTNGISFNGKYDYEYRRNYQAHVFSVKAKYSF